VTITVNPRDEWKQIFDESWRIARDFFYDPGMHGIDWKAVKAKYAAQLPAVYDRSDLTRILGDMIAELNTGHAYVGGGDSDGTFPRRRVPQGFLGAAFEPATGPGGTRAFRVTRVYSWRRLRHGRPLAATRARRERRRRRLLLAVAGQPVKPDSDIASLLVGTEGKTITLTVNTKPEVAGARTVTVRPLSSQNDRNARYYAWVESRREYIRKNAGGAKIAYLHIPDMGETGLREFIKHYYAATADADGIIYDVRDNGGGYISAMLLLQMAARPLSYFKPRYGESWTRQDFGFAGH
jgi:tricorn protease